MPHTICCVEPERRPARATLEVQEGEITRLCLLEPDEASPGLRITALRHQRDRLPQGAELLAELVVSPSATGGPALRVLGVHARRPVEWIRGEARGRLREGAELRGMARLQLVLDDQQRVELHLGLLEAAGGGAMAAVAGSGTRRSQIAAATTGALWLLPTARALMVDFLDQVVENVRALLRRFGLSPRLAATLVALGFLILFNVLYWINQAAEVDASAVAAAEAAEARTRAEVAAAGALASEQRCLSARAEIAGRLGDLEQQRALRAEAALGLPGARAAAVGAGGAAMASDEVLGFDALLLTGLRRQVVADMGTVGEAPVDAAACLQHAPLLGADLPRYALLWHPDPDQSCTAGYAAQRDGVDLAGRWGLSTRVAAEFGNPEAGDLRAEDRAAAQTALAALRAIQGAALSHRSGARSPVAPSQAQLWGLALFGAYNSLPSPADGVLDATAAACVDQALDQIEASAPPPSPGEPLLPDLTAVALGERALPLVPSPGCPWPEGALQRGARLALLAAARLALVEPADGEG